MDTAWWGPVPDLPAEIATIARSPVHPGPPTKGGHVTRSARRLHPAPPSGTLERGLAVLEHVGSRQEISTNAIATQLGLSRSAVYRIVNTLKELDYLEADHVTGRVRLGARLVELGVQAMSSTDLHKAAPQFLAAVAVRSGETIFPAVPDGDAMVYVGKDRGANAGTLHCQLGTRRPQHATSLGKAWLSALPQAERLDRVSRMRLDRLTPHTIVDRA